jgi:hypothetical protein
MQQEVRTAGIFFILATFLTAFFIEGLGSLVSVIGISALFGSNMIIVALAIALDVGKIILVSLLYTFWRGLPKLMRIYALIAAFVTMVITSSGAAGYLSGEFQKAMVGTKETDLKVQVLKDQQAKYQERKKQIDDQIAKLPEKTTVSQRLRLMNGFKAEQQALDAKISKIDEDLPKLQVDQISVEAKAGPIIYISKAFDIPVEQAVKWVILLIIFVFDPLAVFLVIAGNFLLEQRRNSQKPTPPEPDIIVPPRVEATDMTPAAPVEDQVTKTYVDVIAAPPEPAPAPAPEPEVVVEPEPEPSPPVVTPDNSYEYVPELKPQRQIIKRERKKAVTVEHVPEQAPASRTQITRSSLSGVKEDPHTVVDATASHGFQPSRAKR